MRSPLPTREKTGQVFSVGAAVDFTTLTILWFAAVLGIVPQIQQESDTPMTYVNAHNYKPHRGNVKAPNRHARNPRTPQPRPIHL